MPEKKGEKLPGGQTEAVRVRHDVARCDGLNVIEFTARKGELYPGGSVPPPH
jgi:hypothetical protein